MTTHTECTRPGCLNAEHHDFVQYGNDLNDGEEITCENCGQTVVLTSAGWFHTSGDNEHSQICWAGKDFWATPEAGS